MSRFMRKKQEIEYEIAAYTSDGMLDLNDAMQVSQCRDSIVSVRENLKRSKVFWGEALLTQFLDAVSKKTSKSFFSVFTLESEVPLLKDMLGWPVNYAEVVHYAEVRWNSQLVTPSKRRFYPKDAANYYYDFANLSDKPYSINFLAKDISKVKNLLNIWAENHGRTATMVDVAEFFTFVRSREMVSKRAMKKLFYFKVVQTLKLDNRLLESEFKLGNKFAVYESTKFDLRLLFTTFGGDVGMVKDALAYVHKLMRDYNVESYNYGEQIWGLFSHVDWYYYTVILRNRPTTNVDGLCTTLYKLRDASSRIEKFKKEIVKFIRIPEFSNLEDDFNCYYFQDRYLSRKYVNIVQKKIAETNSLLPAVKVFANLDIPRSEFSNSVYGYIKFLSKKSISEKATTIYSNYLGRRPSVDLGKGMEHGYNYMAKSSILRKILGMIDNKAAWKVFTSIIKSFRKANPGTVVEEHAILGALSIADIFGTAWKSTLPKTANENGKLVIEQPSITWLNNFGLQYNGTATAEEKVLMSNILKKRKTYKASGNNISILESDLEFFSKILERSFKNKKLIISKLGNNPKLKDIVSILDAVLYPGLSIEVGYWASQFSLSVDDAEYLQKFMDTNDYFKNYEDLSIKTSNNSYKVSKSGYSIVRLLAHDTEGAVLGKHTGCCQHLQGAADSSVRYGYKQSNSFFFKVLNKSNEVVAISWAWVDSKSNLVFDNVERKHGSDVANIIDIVAEYAFTFAGRFNSVQIGLGFGGYIFDGLNEKFAPVLSSDMGTFLIGNPYTDAANSRVYLVPPRGALYAKAII